jgi:hypothetical protein
MLRPFGRDGNAPAIGDGCWRIVGTAEALVDGVLAARRIAPPWFRIAGVCAECGTGRSLWTCC